jgi:tetratricopeptide (TPR) repeat protein
MKRTAAFILLMALAFPALSQARKVEVAPGVIVTRKTYRVPSNEAPFFNFIEKTDELKIADRFMVEGILKQIPDRGQAARNAATAGWKELRQRQDVATATRRFNQAFLLDPHQSIVYQSFAVIVAEQFKDYDYADELFRIAARMNSPATALSADHGRVMLMAGRPSEAKPLLEKAIQDDPGWAVPRANLAWVALQTGNAAEACRLVRLVAGRDMGAVMQDLELLKQKGNC